ncbi:hypothetical protein KEM52_005044 [Ascosphaera acerosa]|nr:hypothetical protein KEM52_005044 [Ascosphaera acerosa]
MASASLSPEPAAAAPADRSASPEVVGHRAAPDAVVAGGSTDGQQPPGPRLVPLAGTGPITPLALDSHFMTIEIQNGQMNVIEMKSAKEVLGGKQVVDSEDDEGSDDGAIARVVEVEEVMEDEEVPVEKHAPALRENEEPAEAEAAEAEGATEEGKAAVRASN